MSHESSGYSLTLPTISISQFINGDKSVKKSIASMFDESMKTHGFFI